jgi:hypothetical protein
MYGSKMIIDWVTPFNLARPIVPVARKGGILANVAPHGASCASVGGTTSNDRAGGTTKGTHTGVATCTESCQSQGHDQSQHSVWHD